LEPEGDVLEKLIDHDARYFTMVASLEKTPCAWFLYGPELPEYGDANRALRLRDDGRGPEAVSREVIAYFRSRGLPAVADVDAVAEAQGIGSALRRMGIVPVLGDTLWMRYPLPEPPNVNAPGARVDVVPNETGAGEARVWIETTLSDVEGTESAALWRAVAEREARYLACRLYLGLLSGQPAGTCDLFAAEGWGRVESVATRPEFRRRGVASAVVARAVADSLQMGNTVTYLLTEPGGAGEQVYRRLGFVPWGLNILRRHRTAQS